MRAILAELSNVKVVWPKQLVSETQKLLSPTIQLIVYSSKICQVKVGIRRN